LEESCLFLSGIYLAHSYHKKGVEGMERKKRVLSVVILSGSVGLGGQSLSAQSAPEGGQLGPSIPGQTQPGPGLPPLPGQPAPGQPFPGWPENIPETTQPLENQVISPDEIRSAQKALKARGHDPGGITGRLDAQTQDALRDFQKSQNLPATGVLDDKTASKLGVNLNQDERSLPQRDRGGTAPMPDHSR
jgi:Putative peptidoglycan binding domain